MAVRIGTAGWSVPSHSDCAPGEGSHIERYGKIFNAVEINSSFHRRHRRSTYERWAAVVGPDFRFAVKLPRAITHDRKLVDCDDLIARFAEESAGLGVKRGPVLVQLPPSLAYSSARATAFFATLGSAVRGIVACEPQHPSWFEPDAGAFSRNMAIARVAADPARTAGANEPGGWPKLAYISGCTAHRGSIIPTMANGSASIVGASQPRSPSASRPGSSMTIRPPVLHSAMRLTSFIARMLLLEMLA